MISKSVAPFEELLSTRAKIGRGLPPRRQPSELPLYEFGSGKPDPASFPFDGMLEATARMLKAEGAEAMTYGDPQGYLGLRELIGHKYELLEGLKVTPENLIIGNGSNHAISLAIGAFIDVGDVMICEVPTYIGTINTMRRHGAVVLDAPIDDEGMVTDAVREHLQTLRRQGRRCKLIYTIDNFQNPAGPTLSLRRRRELVALAEEFDTMILEDDAYGELRFEGEQLPSLYELDDGRRVIRAGTLSKILGAGVRLGWLCARPDLIPVLQSFNFGGGASPFMSRVAVYYLRDHLTEHIDLLRPIYREKRDAMIRGLSETLDGTDFEVSRPEGGFFLWLKVPSGTHAGQLAELSAEARLQYQPGPSFFINGGGEPFLRLAFSYESPEKCYEGGRVLGQAIRDSII